MEQPTAGTQAEANPKEARKSKQAGQSCITLFVVFVVVAVSFNLGKPPWHSVLGEQGSRLNLDLLSCLGLAAGIYAVVFLAANLRRVLRLSAAKKTLGLIGAIGLVAHVALALFIPLSYGMAQQPAGTGGNVAIGQGGPEQWTVGGKTYQIASTYYLRLPEGLQFTIEYPYRFTAGAGGMNDQRALEVVFPLMRHAFQSGAYKRTSATKVGAGQVEPTRIGVALVERSANGASGYRVALSVDEIRRRVEQEAKTAPTSSPGSL